MKQEEYRSQLLDCSRHPDDKVQRKSILVIQKNGWRFVSKGEVNHLQLPVLSSFGFF